MSTIQPVNEVTCVGVTVTEGCPETITDRKMLHVYSLYCILSTHYEEI